MTIHQKQQVREALIRVKSITNQQRLQLSTIPMEQLGQIPVTATDNISDEAWQELATQVGFYCGDWFPAETSTYMLLKILFSDARNYSHNHLIGMAQGLGKTFAARQYIANHQEVYYVACDPAHNCHEFMLRINQAVGASMGGTTPELQKAAIAAIEEKNEPLIIVDDAHLLKDRVLRMLLTICGKLNGLAGMVLLGRPELNLRVSSICASAGNDKMNRCTLKEIVSVLRPMPGDCALICQANGLDDVEHIGRLADQCTPGFHHLREAVQLMVPLKFAA